MHKRAVTNYGTTGNTNTSLSTISPNYWSNSCRPVDPNVSPTCFVAQITIETSTVNRWSLKTVFSPSLFMPASMHLRSRQARHWFRCILSTAHVSGWPRDLQSYFRPLRTDRWQFTLAKQVRVRLNYVDRMMAFGASRRTRVELRQPTSYFSLCRRVKSTPQLYTMLTGTNNDFVRVQYDSTWDATAE